MQTPFNSPPAPRPIRHTAQDHPADQERSATQEEPVPRLSAALREVARARHRVWRASSHSERARQSGRCARIDFQRAPGGHTTLRQPSSPVRRNSQCTAAPSGGRAGCGSRTKRPQHHGEIHDVVLQRDHRLVEQGVVEEAHAGGDRHHVERDVPVGPPGLGDGTARQERRRAADDDRDEHKHPAVAGVVEPIGMGLPVNAGRPRDRPP